jgi:hypothetical protein
MENKSIANYVSYTTTVSDYGLKYDSKGCWESTENHFICLDKVAEVYGRH